MRLPTKYFEPFDITYREVTSQIRLFRLGASHDGSAEWLSVLTDRFWVERHLWEANLENNFQYREYFSVASRLRWKVLHLTACAYLHISYDLPRVLADNWPGTGNFRHGPDEAAGERAYFALHPVFQAAIIAVWRNPKVVGIAVVLSRIFPEGTSAVLVQSALHLRRAAWMHAERLRNASNRRYIEERMLEAMTAALRHVLSLKPWTAAGLMPPDEQVFVSVSGLLVAQYGFSNFDGSSVLSIAAIAISVLALAVTILTNWIRMNWEKFKEISEFIEEFARRVDEYVEYAVFNPESLSEYLWERDPTRRRGGNSDWRGRSKEI